MISIYAATNRRTPGRGRGNCPQERPAIADTAPKDLPRHESASGGQRGLLDVREAAAYVGLSKSTLDKMRCFGTGPRYIKLTSAAVRYDPSDLKEWIAARRSSPE